MENVNAILGTQLRNFRIMKGLSLEELAHKAGINPSHLGKVERGDHNYTVNTLDKIVSALNISYTQLFQFEADVGQAETPVANPLIEKTLAYLTVLSVEEQQHIYKTVQLLSEKK